MRRHTADTLYAAVARMDTRGEPFIYTKKESLFLYIRLSPPCSGVPVCVYVLYVNRDISMIYTYNQDTSNFRVSMMYCSNCQCPSCHAQRAAEFSADKASGDVIRLVRRAGPTGLTANQLKTFSRHFRGVDAEAQALLLDQLTMAGVLIKHRFPAPVRGRWRDAYLTSEVSQ